ncbi:MAG: hypothetical protein UU66_C0028G0002 [Parcubacteria group bacterium GW2011_GWB1_41_5]|nr:MAG: hypothetical protein UU66_C0028G0002 [Parcubacteria group bacterium GW2011_GWB1_41_5]
MKQEKTLFIFRRNTTIMKILHKPLLLYCLFLSMLAVSPNFASAQSGACSSASIVAGTCGTLNAYFNQTIIPPAPRASIEFSPSVGVEPLTNLIITNGGLQKNVSVINQNIPAFLVEDTYFILRTTVPYNRYYVLDSSRGYNFLLDKDNQPIVFPRPNPLQFFLVPEIWRIHPILGFTQWNNQTRSGQVVSRAEQINIENKIIDTIDKNKKIVYAIPLVQPVTGTPSAGSIAVEVPATNCARLSGNGPRKIVFMRGNSWTPTVNDFLWQAYKVIDEGFKVIDPFKKYINEFSFYIDLKGFDESKILPKEYMGVNYFDISSMGEKSSCDSVIGSADQYLFYFNKPGYSNPFTSIDKPISFFNLNGDITDYLNSSAVIAIHETGHGFAGLSDEYTYSNTKIGSLYNLLKVRSTIDKNIFSTENCTSNPTWDYRSPYDNRVYGSVVERGCSFSTKSNLGGRATEQEVYYRPSPKSIMNVINLDVDVNDPNNRFNIVSCGYIIAAIKGEPLDQKHAAKYWPECSTLDVVDKNQLAAVLPAPVLTSPVSISSTVGGEVTITGSNFTPTGNTVQLKYIGPLAKKFNFFNLASVIEAVRCSIISCPSVISVSTDTVFEIPDIVSDGRSLVFNVPENLPSGRYSVKVGTFNGDWSKESLTLSINTSGIPYVVFPNGGEIFVRGNFINIEWNSQPVPMFIVLSKDSTPNVRRVWRASPNQGSIRAWIDKNYIPGNDYRINVYYPGGGLGPARSDKSNGTFSIISEVSSPTLQDERAPVPSSTITVAEPTPTQPFSAPTEQAVPATSPTASIFLTSSNENKVGTVGVYAPGSFNSNPNDWKFSLVLNMNGNTKIVSSIRITGSGATQGDVWTTNTGNWPIVVFRNGQQLNTRVGQIFSVGPSVETLHLYAQQSGKTTWGGGNLTITFSDGTSITTNIPVFISASRSSFTASVWKAFLSMFGM